MKAYLRRAEFLPIVRDALAQAFGPETDVVYLQADICRSNLLLEVEGVYVQPAPREKVMRAHFAEATASGGVHE